MSKYIDPEMIITKFREKAYKKIEETILNDVYKVTMELDTYVDKKKLKQWLEMCAELDKIDESERINDAIREKFKEKDKEIEELKQQIENNQKDYVSELAYYTAEENIKNIRHQVCEEIREKTQYFDDCWRIKEIIDQIEKGENDAKK